MKARDSTTRAQAATGLGLRSAIAGLSCLALIVAAPPCSAGNDGEPFDVAKLFFQLNDTDGDLGIHAIIDGEAWKKLEIKDPDERMMLGIWTIGRLRKQGLTELRFESAEPNFEELAPEEFLKRFPRGRYEITGVTLDGRELESAVRITHVLPAPPTNLQVSGMRTPADCDEGPVPEVPAGAITISWDAVTTSHPTIGKSGAITVVRYELAVEREEPTTLILTADVPPDVTSFTVPAGLLNAEDEIKFQVLATDRRGNETSAESCFVVQ